MSKRHTLSLNLRAIAARWVEDAQRRRLEADAETDKVWSARQYGLADTLEDAAQHLTASLDGQNADTAHWASLAVIWLRLAAETAHLAESDDNRLPASYRRASAEAYERAAAEVRAALEEANVESGPPAQFDLTETPESHTERTHHDESSTL
jgi:hypothetical protein